MKKVEITIPCDSCGCSEYFAKTKNGRPCKIEVCKCLDDPNNYDVTIYKDNEEIEFQTHRCCKDEITDCLNGHFDIDINTVIHNCFE
jgi:hypothetical protein